MGTVLSPYPADLMEDYRVSALGNRTSNDRLEVATPVEEEVQPFRSDQADPPLSWLLTDELHTKLVYTWRTWQRTGTGPFITL